MKKNLIIGLGLFFALGFYGCNSTVVDPKKPETSRPVSLPSPSTLTSASPPSAKFNFIDPNNLSTPSCQNSDVLTGNIYSNKANTGHYGIWFDSLAEYLKMIKNEVTLEGVEISYNDKKIVSDKNGTFYMPRERGKEIKMTFAKTGYYPLTTDVPDSCLIHVGLSPLSPDELQARTVVYKSYTSEGGAPNSGDYPSYLIKDSKTGFAYSVIKTKDKFNEIKNTVSGDNLAILESNIDAKKEILILFSSNTGIFGMQSDPINSVMESDDKVILSAHKSKCIDLLPANRSFPMMGDTFRIYIQALSIPYTSKKLVFNFADAEKTNSLEVTAP